MNPTTTITFATHACHSKPLLVTLTAALLGAAGASPCAAQFGGFLNFQNYATGSLGNLRVPAFGDFNGDGVLDAAIPSPTSNVAIMLGSPDGDFTLDSTPDAFGMPEDVEIGDFDEDGVLDLAVLCVGDGTPSNPPAVRLYRGAGDGSFSEVGTLPVGISRTGLAIADFDLDGRLDLAITDDETDPLGLTPDFVTIYPGLGDFQFGAGRVYFTPPIPSDIKVQDVNMDGAPDLIISSINWASNLTAPGRVAVLTNNGAGEFVQTSSSAVGAFPVFITIGDVNSDGAPDLFTVNDISRDVSMLLSDGQGGFFPEVRIDPTIVGSTSTTTINAFALGDIDGDGDLDITMTTRTTDPVLPTTHKVEVRIGHGDGAFDHLISYGAPQQIRAIELFDVNNDSSPDFIGVFSTGGVGVMANVTPMRAPLSFSLVSPADGAAGVPVPGDSNLWPGTVAALDWQDAAAFNHTYAVQVATDPEFINVVIVAGGLTESRFPIPAGTLQPGTTYYWNVVASNPTGATLADPGMFSFTTATPADLNGDGNVNGADLASLLASWSIPN